MAKLSVQLLSLLFGTGSWIAITGLWLEVPVLIERLPESWALASDMNFVIQLANVGPIVYFVCKRYKWLNETNASHILMAIGLASCLLLITCWDKTFVVAGSERSVPLFVATFGLALLDCASSVTFLPFMARFDNNYLTPYLIGEGLSGFLPTIFALLQGVQQSESCEAYNEMSVNASASDAKHLSQLTFSAQYFFVSLLFTLMISWLALILLQILPVCKQEVRPMEAKERPTDRESIRKLHDKSPENVLSIDSQNNYKIPTKKNIGKHKYNYFLCLILLCCLSTFGFMPSIQPYSALPYGNSTLHYIVILSGLSYPFGCFLAMLFISFEEMAKLSVQLLSLLFGTGSWIAITGLWLEVPVLIERLPESWALASDMNFVIQLANVGPIVYFVCKRYKWLNETNASHILMAIGLASCLLLITCWDKTFVVWGSERSVPLFVATFGLALLDCASSVTFLPFMARFDNNYLTPYLIGE
ncbi:unnamed protein product, partial [Oppiella nova]